MVILSHRNCKAGERERRANFVQLNINAKVSHWEKTMYWRLLAVGISHWAHPMGKVCGRYTSCCWQTYSLDFLQECKLSITHKEFFFFYLSAIKRQLLNSCLVCFWLIKDWLYISVCIYVKAIAYWFHNVFIHLCVVLDLLFMSISHECVNRFINWYIFLPIFCLCV